MGTDIDKEEFDERDYSRFAERLEECLAVLAQLLNRPGFGTGPATIGAELELFLIDGAGRPLPHNQAIRAAVADPRVTVELDRFNLELNASPALLAGRPFTALGGELNLLVDRMDLRTAVRTGRSWLLPRRPARLVRPAELASRAPRPNADRFVVRHGSEVRGRSGCQDRLVAGTMGA